MQSENYDENYQEYHVKTIVKNGRHYIACNCMSGLKGLTCKHRRWAIAAAKQEKAALNEQASSLIIDGQPADSETLARIEKANKNAKVDRSARAPKYKPFSLLR